MNWHTAYEVAKYWAAWGGLALTLGKIYFTAKKALGNWFNRIAVSFEGYLAKAVDNHMTHVQTDVNRAATAICDLAEVHKGLMANQNIMCQSLVQMQAGLHEHIKDDDRVQGEILTGIEVIKAKL
jgi:hypothetical protein